MSGSYNFFNLNIKVSFKYNYDYNDIKVNLILFLQGKCKFSNRKCRNSYKFKVIHFFWFHNTIFFNSEKTRIYINIPLKVSYFLLRIFKISMLILSVFFFKLFLNFHNLYYSSLSHFSFSGIKPYVLNLDIIINN